MALLWYGLPQMSSVWFKAESVGWMAELKIRASQTFECKNHILPVIAESAKPYYKTAMLSQNNNIKFWNEPIF